MTRYRRASPVDSRVCFEIFQEAIEDLGRRTGGAADATADAPDPWAVRRPLFDHLAATGDAWWIAEDQPDGRAVGYARSIVRDGVRELTEFFVRPSAQSAGAGRALLARAFGPEGARHRAIIATIDPRAIARYLRTGLDVRATIVGMEATPRPVSIATDLTREPIDPDTIDLAALAWIDRALLDLRRDQDHAWFARERVGWLYRRAGQPAGYAYHPRRPTWGGPYAALDPADLPTLLADAESAAAAAGHGTLTFDVPLPARSAVDHLLQRGFRVDPFVMLFFSDAPADGLDRYVLTSPPFFL